MTDKSRSERITQTRGRQATKGVISGRYSLSVGDPDKACPKEWKWTPLAAVARLESGHTPSRRVPHYWDGDIPWIGIRDATENHGRTIYSTYQTVTQAGIDNSAARVLPAGTVCLSRTASIGYVVVMGCPMATSQDFVNWVCSEAIDSHFLKYVLLSEHSSMFRFASGTTHQTIYFPEVKAFHVCMPNIHEQRAITHILGTLDDKIELNRRMNETLEAMARALFKAWFVDFEPVRAKAEGRDTGLPPHLTELFPSRLVNSELGEVPEGWKTGTIGSVAENPRRGVAPEKIEPGTPYIGLEHMPRHSIALVDWGYADDLESNKFEFKQGEILFGKLRPYFHKVGVAPVDGVCSTDILVVVPKEAEWFGFVLGHVSSVDFVNHTYAGSTGTKMPRTNWRDMAGYEVAMPSRLIAQFFTQQIRPLVERINVNVHASRTLATMRDALLPKLISGEIRVRDAERFVRERI